MAEALSPRPLAQLLRIAVLSLHASPLAKLGRGGDGGLNVYVREVCRAFSERGVETDVFTAASAGTPGVQRLAALSRVVSVPVGPEAADKYGLFDRVPRFARGVASWWRDYDLVYSHYWLSGASAAWLKARFGVPWVHTAHTLAIVKNRHLADGSVPEPAFRIGIERHISKGADLLVASTSAERHDLIDAYGAAPGRVLVIPPGVDHGRFVPRDEERRYLLFAGRLEPLKGAEIALRAFALVAAGHPSLELVILGEDSRDGARSERRRLQDIARELGLEHRVRFPGSVDQSALPNWYAGAIACLVPSYSESFGLVALEAQASGVPVVAADLPGLASIVRDAVTGYLVRGQDPRAYADRLRELLADPEATRQMGRRATLLAQRFSWQRTAERLLATMSGLAQAGVQARARHE